MSDLISRQDALDGRIWVMQSASDSAEIEHLEAVPVEYLKGLPSAQPERVWTPCDIPPKHHRDVIVRGIEPIGGECVYKVMQWDVDTWRPKDYAPSIVWLEWCEI